MSYNYSNFQDYNNAVNYCNQYYREHRKDNDDDWIILNLIRIAINSGVTNKGSIITAVHTGAGFHHRKIAGILGAAMGTRYGGPRWAVDRNGVYSLI